MKTDPRFFESLSLFPYQAAFAANDSRFKIGLWARQTGKDHTATLEAVLDCLHNPGTTWIILAAGERQALESLAKARDWARLLKFEIAGYSETPANLPLAEARSAGTEIKWSNGSRLLALPANPQTVRGYSANLILTEFAFHEDADAIWRAIYPSISNPLRGGRKKLRIISTPNGLNNKFAQLWLNNPTQGVPPSGGPSQTPDEKCSTRNARSTSPANALPHSCPAPSTAHDEDRSPLAPPRGEDQGEGSIIPCPSFISASPALLPSLPSLRSVETANLYHKSKITIHDAIASGLSLNAAELRSGLDDDDAWSQEYLCEFMDTSTVLFPYDLIAPCECTQATESIQEPDALRTSASNSGPSGDLFAGIDFGRKHHLTVCWILEAIPNSASSSVPHAPHLFVTREVLCLKNTSTPDQLEILKPRLQRCRKICLDYTGAGVGLGDYLAQTFCRPGAPTGRSYDAPAGYSSDILELCQFTAALKAELFPRLRAAFEQRILRIPISREIREDLHAVQRTVTQSGQITYRAPQSPDGHSDRTTALALALRAASTAPARRGISIVRVPGRTADLSWARHVPRISTVIYGRSRRY